jgi:hypothetical protein
MNLRSGLLLFSQPYGREYQMMANKFICLTGLLLALLSPVPSIAQVTFYVTAEGDKAFTIEGDDIEAKSAVELTVVYNSNYLSNPHVRLAQGTVTELVDSVPGTVIIKAIQGDDSTATFEAHLGFDRTGDSQGGIFSVTGKIMEPDGTVSSTRTLPGNSSPFAVQSFSGDEETPTEETASSQDSSDILITSKKSVLQRFRDFKGKRGLKKFVALFDRNQDERIVQEPPVLISDGKTPVRITLPLMSEEGEAPDIALSDAKLVHLVKEEKGWVVTALPNEGSWEATLLIKMAEKVIEYPLVVAPVFSIHKMINESNFVSELDFFLSDRLGTGKGENNPLQHILFEYVFTANYLASSGSAIDKMTSGLTYPMSESN